MQRIIAVEERTATDAFLDSAHRLDVVPGERAEIGLMRIVVLRRRTCRSCQRLPRASARLTSSTVSPSQSPSKSFRTVRIAVSTRLAQFSRRARSSRKTARAARPPSGSA
jgi:hypothetical protein